jgi:6,7-dimethyl-8-ribityllumazine synthase
MHLLFIEATFYPHITKLLHAGAEAAVKAAGGTFEVVEVPGALEIPLAIASSYGRRFDGYVALGTVIRGQTAHYDVVAQQSAAGLVQLGLREHLAIGNGILTVDTEAQALERADPAKRNKGKAKSKLLTPRYAARLLAVQGVYQYALNPSPLADFIPALLEDGGFLLEDEALHPRREATPIDAPLCRQLVAGAVHDEDALDALITAHLAENWRIERLDSVVLALLRVAVWEAKNALDVPTAVLVDEYVDIAKSYFHAKEPKFVHQVLDSIAKAIRN